MSATPTGTATAVAVHRIRLASSAPERKRQEVDFHILEILVPYDLVGPRSIVPVVDVLNWHGDPIRGRTDVWALEGEW